MKNTLKIEENHRSPLNTLRMQSFFAPHHQAMLAALRVVLNLLATPTVLGEEPLNQGTTSQNRLTIYSITSDVYNLIPGTYQERTAYGLVMTEKMSRRKRAF